MNTATKKIVGSLFILLVTAPWLFVFIFIIRQDSIRHQMEEKLEKNIPQQVIALHENDIQWIKKGKEIVVNNRMFDIKTMTTRNGITTFTGLYDDQETSLKEQLTEGWRKNEPARNYLLVQVFFSLQYVISNTNSDSLLYSLYSMRTPVLTTPSLPEIYKVIPTPPPQV